MPLGKQISLPWSTIFPTGEKEERNMKKSFKRFAAILLGLALLATSATVAFAAGDDKTVTFTGDKLAANYTDTSVAQQLFTMQPGDTTTIDIELENKVGSSATWYLNNAVLKSLEQNSPNGASARPRSSGAARISRRTPWAGVWRS